MMPGKLCCLLHVLCCIIHGHLAQMPFYTGIALSANGAEANTQRICT